MRIEFGERGATTKIRLDDGDALVLLPATYASYENARCGLRIKATSEEGGVANVPLALTDYVAALQMLANRKVMVSKDLTEDEIKKLNSDIYTYLCAKICKCVIQADGVRCEPAFDSGVNYFKPRTYATLDEFLAEVTAYTEMGAQ